MITKFVLLFIVGIGGLEAFSYVLHRWLFHGLLWPIHRTHHLPRRGMFELNDVFSLFFASLASSLLIFAPVPLMASWQFPLGLGVAVYGLLYFVAHDLFTHRRWLPFKHHNATLNRVRRAHQRHHQSVTKEGQEPFGLFWFSKGSNK